MRITFQDLISKANEKNWLHRCMLDCLTDEAIKSGMETESYEVKLLVNGIELEPTILGELLGNIEAYIDGEAIIVAEKKLKAAMAKADRLNDIVVQACRQIGDEFNIDVDE